MSVVHILSDCEFEIALTDEELIVVQAWCMANESKPYKMLKLLFDTAIELMANRIRPNPEVNHGNTLAT